MGITQRISADQVILDLEARNRQELLRLLAADAGRRLGREPQEILEALQAREKLGSTALGKGVALPHARLEGDAPPLMLFARLRRPIDYEARDEEKVDLAMLVLWPDSAPEGFLPALSGVCQAMRAPEALHRLRKAGSAEEVASLLGLPAQPAEAAPERA